MEKSRPGGHSDNATETNSQAISVLSDSEGAGTCENGRRTCGKSDAHLTRGRSAAVHPLSAFEREMQAKARKESDRPTKEHFLSSALAAKALADPVDDDHKDRLVANLRNLATGIAAHRQAQGGGR